MKILLTGDLVVNRPYDPSNIEDSLKNLFASSDFNIVNLEAPITSQSQKLLKTGPHLKADKGSTKAVFRALNVNMVTLANNHILDYGDKGVLDTIGFCESNKIQPIGAGKDKTEASRIFYLDTREGKIAFLNFAENEWSSASEDSAGGNGMDLIDDLLKIQEAKSRANYVFIIVHGGHEYYNLPSPRMQKQYRFYIDNGADIVVGHHPHCLSGSEVYNGKQIYYSLGNFLFTKNSVFEDWYTGAVLEVNLKGGKIDTSLHFVSQNREDFSLRKASNVEALQYRITEYNKIIANPLELVKYWNAFVITKTKLFTSYWSPLSVFNKKLKILLLKMGFNGLTKRNSALFYNLIKCEAHRDLSLHFFKNKIYRK